MLHSYRTPSWFDLMCCFSVYWCLVVKLHWSQVIGFIAKWIIWWFCKYCFLLNAVLHWSQIKALRFEWRVWWSLNLPLLDKDFSHWGQAWGLSMLCLAWCLIKSALFLKHLLHFSHWWGFKFMWTIWWPFYTNLFLTALPHCKQEFFWQKPTSKEMSPHTLISRRCSFLENSEERESNKAGRSFQKKYFATVGSFTRLSNHID